MSLEIFIAVLKLVGTAITVGFAIACLGFQTRDPSSGLTKNGRVALTGMVVGFLITVLMQYFEFEQQGQKAVAARDLAHAQETRHRQQLDGLRKNLLLSRESILSTNEASLRAKVLIKSDTFEPEYLRRIGALAAKSWKCPYSKTPASELLDAVDYHCSGYRAHSRGGAVTLEFDRRSRLFPSERELIARTALKIPLQLTFYDKTGAYLGDVEIPFENLGDDVFFAFTSTGTTGEVRDLVGYVQTDLSPKAFRKANVTSLLQIAGGRVEAFIPPANCLESALSNCDQLNMLSATGVRVGSLHIEFPHGRNLDFEEASERLTFAGVRHSLIHRARTDIGSPSDASLVAPRDTSPTR
jgi:hypothetical protein